MPTPDAHYEARISTMRETLAATARLSMTVSIARVGVFLVMVSSIGAFVLARANEGGAIAVAALLVFVALVVWHAKIVLREDREKAALEFSTLGLARVADRFEELPARGESFRDKGLAPYAHDLDLFGKRSLLAILDAMGTSLSETKLAAWLSSPAKPAEILRRQDAVRELANQTDLRERLYVHARGHEGEADLGPFLAWCARKEDEGSQSPLLLVGFVLPAITLALIFAPELVGASPRAWLVPGAIQGLLAFVIARRASLGLAAAMTGTRALASHGAVIGQLAKGSFTSPLLRELGAKFTDGEASARDGLAKLDRLASFAEARESGVFGALIGPFVLYDLHLLLALRRWRRAYGSHVQGWIDALGDLLSLAGLATYAFDHPALAFPEVHDGPLAFRATKLAHPLVPAEKRIANDVTFDGPGTALLVTGSNMSGKSTMLRSIGSAAVMAQAGAPVAAASLSISPLAVRTSIRVNDSLAEGVSHFYAELLALRAVVEDADRQPLLFLLDEILHGTNSRERQAGAKSVIKHVLAKGAMGAVSTHDLGLVELCDELPGKVRPVHFVEHSENGKMAFDYLLRDGVLTSGNALALMKQLGLPVDV